MFAEFLASASQFADVRVVPSCDRPPKDLHLGPGRPRTNETAEAIRSEARKEPTLNRRIDFAKAHGLHLETVSTARIPSLLSYTDSTL